MKRHGSNMKQLLQDIKKKLTGFPLKGRMNKKLQDTRVMVNKMAPKARQLQTSRGKKVKSSMK